MIHPQDLPASSTHCKPSVDISNLPLMSQQTTPITPTPITLTPFEFWQHVKNDEDCNEILERLDNHNELVSHFLFFSSLARTIDELDDLAKKKKKEIGHVFTEMTHLPNFRRLTEPLVRRKHRLHPYQRSPISPQPSSSSPNTNTSSNRVASFAETVPILSLPSSPISAGDSPTTPIDVDSLPSSSDVSSYVTAPLNPPTRPTTPEPPFGTAHRIHHDDITHFTHNGVFHVREEFSGNIYFEEDFYDLPRPSYRHSLPQVRLPTTPSRLRRDQLERFPPSSPQ